MRDWIKRFCMMFCKKKYKDLWIIGKGNLDDK